MEKAIGSTDIQIEVLIFLLFSVLITKEVNI